MPQGHPLGWDMLRCVLYTVPLKFPSGTEPPLTAKSPAHWCPREGCLLSLLPDFCLHPLPGLPRTTSWTPTCPEIILGSVSYEIQMRYGMDKHHKGPAPRVGPLCSGSSILSPSGPKQHRAPGVHSTACCWHSV